MPKDQKVKKTKKQTKEKKENKEKKDKKEKKQKKEKEANAQNQKADPKAKGKDDASGETSDSLDLKALLKDAKKEARKVCGNPCCTCNP